MKINQLSFKNHAHRWELEKTTFSDLTLLVGASGVGKTQILKSIVSLMMISNGASYNGVEWDLHFTAVSDLPYRWTGEFESIKETGVNPPKLKKEKLYLGDILVFDRTESTVIFEGKESPKISPYTSVLDLFISEDKIVPVKNAFKKITFIDYVNEIEFSLAGESATNIVNKIKRTKTSSSNEKSKNLENLFMQIIEANTTIMLKLQLVWLLFRETFDEIVRDFKEVFPTVEDVRFILFKEHDIYELQIKEKGTDWISRSEMSGGMFKTLLHIAEISLMADGYVILIDEFENSLGVNCIDAVAGDLLKPGSDMQYIITSHHPYIINNIDMKYWKVVTRKGSKVSTIDAEKLKLGKSKHEAFKQLLNLEEFAEGIA
jgi:ABC-type Na+ transport system ATPase subunit NatA